MYYCSTVLLFSFLPKIKKNSFEHQIICRMPFVSKLVIEATDCASLLNHRLYLAKSSANLAKSSATVYVLLSGESKANRKNNPWSVRVSPQMLTVHG